MQDLVITLLIGAAAIYIIYLAFNIDNEPIIFEKIPRTHDLTMWTYEIISVIEDKKPIVLRIAAWTHLIPENNEFVIIKRGNGEFIRCMIRQMERPFMNSPNNLWLAEIELPERISR